MRSIKFKMDDIQVRGLCIGRGWYTCGNNEAYANMFSLVNKAQTADDILEIAADIWEHSDKVKIMTEYAESVEETLINNIANALLILCCYVYIGY